MRMVCLSTVITLSHVHDQVKTRPGGSWKGSQVMSMGNHSLIPCNLISPHFGPVCKWVGSGPWPLTCRSTSDGGAGDVAEDHSGRFMDCNNRDMTTTY